MSEKTFVLRENWRHVLVPIYDMRLLILVTNDVGVSRHARNHLYGEPHNDSSYAALCCYDEYRVAIMLERRNLCHELIAHEVFHLTHRILEWNSAAFGVHNHEPFAHLCGYLTGVVYAQLKRMKERVLFTWPPRIYRKGEPKIL